MNWAGTPTNATWKMKFFGHLLTARLMRHHARNKTAVSRLATIREVLTGQRNKHTDLDLRTGLLALGWFARKTVGGTKPRTDNTWERNLSVRSCYLGLKDLNRQTQGKLMLHCTPPPNIWIYAPS